MDYQRKRELAETAKPLTFEGIPCKVAGWANEYATVTALFPGFYQAAWETVEHVVEGDGNFTVDDVTLINMRWLGSIELPEKIRTYYNIPAA